MMRVRRISEKEDCAVPFVSEQNACRLCKGEALYTNQDQDGRREGGFNVLAHRSRVVCKEEIGVLQDLPNKVSKTGIDLSGFVGVEMSTIKTFFLSAKYRVRSASCCEEAKYFCFAFPMLASSGTWLARGAFNEAFT